MIRAILCTLLMLSTATAVAQTFPAKPIRVIIGYPPASGPDMVTRLIGERVVQRWGQPLVIENRPGASGHIATEAVAKAAPDGYTILATPPAFATTPFMFASLPFDPDTMVPITVAITQANVVMVHPGRLPGIKTLPELIAHAKAKPGTLTYGTSGNGGSHHLSAELMKMLAGGLDVQHVPYKGIGVITAMLAGEVDMGYYTLGGSLAHIKSGKLRPLAVGSGRRHRDLPDVATMGEVMPGLVSATWTAYLAPAGTSPDVVQRINTAFVEALQVPEVQQKLYAATAEVVGNTPAEAAAFIKEEKERWGKVIRAANVKAD